MSNSDGQDIQQESPESGAQNIPDNVKAPEFNELKDTRGGEGGNNGMERILDIPVTLSVELGRTRMVINELLQLGQGSVVELDKIAGEPMEIHVNDRLVARGEVVVVNEKYGVRLTDIISHVERIKDLSK
ncbi:MAG: flagellar motor switch protein FliN [Deltaproteobacteria bacterium]|nr:flagellar motor switch protein FliN [Deltaproteobacteria bacterium]